MVFVWCYWLATLPLLNVWRRIWFDVCFAAILIIFLILPACYAWCGLWWIAGLSWGICCWTEIQWHDMCTCHVLLLNVLWLANWYPLPCFRLRLFWLLWQWFMLAWMECVKCRAISLLQIMTLMIVLEGSWHDGGVGQ